MKLREAVDAYEKRLICEALASNAGDVRRTASQLGLPERSLWRRLKAHDIEPGRFRIKDPDEAGVRKLLEQAEAIAKAYRQSGARFTIELAELAERLWLSGVKAGSPEASELITRSVMSDSFVTVKTA